MGVQIRRLRLALPPVVPALDPVHQAGADPLAEAEAAGEGVGVGQGVGHGGDERRPLDLEPFHLAEWPVTQTVKCLCFYHPDDNEELKARQERELWQDGKRRVERGMEGPVAAHEKRAKAR